MSDSLSEYVRVFIQGEPSKYSNTFISYGASSWMAKIDGYGGVSHVSSPISGIQFNGSTSYLFPNWLPIHPGSADFTIDILYRPTVLPTSDTWPGSWNSCHCLCGFGTPNGTDGINLVLGKTQIFANNNNVKVAAGTHGMSVNNLYHICLEKYGTTLKTYVGGVQKGSYTIGTSSVGTGSGFYIGSWTGTGAVANGIIKQLRYTSHIARFKAAFTAPTSLDPPTEPNKSRIIRPLILNPWFGGDGQIDMPIDELSVYGSYRCDLYSAESRQLLASKMSGSDGALTWMGLDRSRQYFGVAHDPEQILRPGISDKFITPDKMP